jgi:hypothetical protein
LAFISFEFWVSGFELGDALPTQNPKLKTQN